MSELPLTFTCDAILFDMDGTLIDSTAVVERQWRRWAALHQLDVGRILAISHGRKTIDTMREVAPHLELTVEDAACFDEAEGRDGDGVAPVAGALQILSDLRDGQWAVVTSAGTELAGIRFRQAGLPLPTGPGLRGRCTPRQAGSRRLCPGRPPPRRQPTSGAW